MLLSSRKEEKRQSPSPLTLLLVAVVVARAQVHRQATQRVFTWRHRRHCNRLGSEEVVAGGAFKQFQ